ncbi:MAG: aldehyde ferredoxin oxidoreductase family protein [Bacteroidales bacterium]|nr:aldehyde ferredoxin oxidoreductase family protein [Bacteroidales bacterium]
MSYTGKCLKIDLTKASSKIEDSDRSLIEKYIGGKGLGFALLNNLSPDSDAFSPENPVIFVNGPFTGTKVQTSARTTLVTKSPLTNSALDSHCGGNFGPRLKAAGFDYLIITGKSEKPAYIYINNDKIEINEADDLWGKGIFYVNDELIKRHQGINPRVAAIGIAGENLSKIACIGVDKHRQYGRGGAGAVLGSKNLKAIIVDGDTPIKYFDAEKFKEINKQFTKDILDNEGVKFRRIKGTMKCVRSGQENEFLPTKNFQLVQFDDFEKISSEAAREELNWEDTSCYNCSIRCSKWARWDEHEIEGPEYETTAFLGSGSMVNNIKDVSWANELCNDLGLDTISTGVNCSFAMECYEKGLLDDWQGLEMDWGDAENQREFIKLIAKREKVGKIFADGTRDAAAKIGKGSESFAINTYGMEHSGVNPKGALTMAVVMAVADFASHTRLWCTEAEMGPDFKIEDIPQTVADGLDEINVRNCLVICDFVPLGLDRLAPLLNAATGFNFSAESLAQVGTNITNLARKYNLRNGRKASDDTLPGRFFDEESLSGFMRGKKIDRKFFKSIVKEYYDIRGWNENGEPV